MRIIRCESIGRPIHVQAADSFILSVDGVEVHRAKITQAKTITHWALVEIAGGLGYFIGDEDLPAELERLAGL